MRGEMDVLLRAPWGLDTFPPSLNGNVQDERSAEIRREHGAFELAQSRREPSLSLIVTVAGVRPPLPTASWAAEEIQDPQSHTGQETHLLKSYESRFKSQVMLLSRITQLGFNGVSAFESQECKKFFSQLRQFKECAANSEGSFGKRAESFEP